MVEGIGNVSVAKFDALRDAVGVGDIHQVLMALGLERAAVTESAVKTKIATIRENNAKVASLNQIYASIDAAPRRGPDASDLRNAGEAMKTRQALNGYDEVLLDPDKKAALEKYGVDPGKSVRTWYDNKGTNYPSYTTADFRAAADKAVAKANAIEAGTDPAYPAEYIDLNGKIPNSNPPQTYKQALEKAGVDWQGGDLIQQDKLKDLRSALDIQVKSMTSNDQLDMIELQSLVSKQTNAVEVVSTMVKKKADQDDSVLRKW